MIKDLNELFNGQSFHEYSKVAEVNLPVGLKILEAQGPNLVSNEEKVKNWISCYGLKMDNFPTIDETNTLVNSESFSGSSYITYQLPFTGDSKFFAIKPNGNSHILKCTIDETNKKLLVYYPVSKNNNETEQKVLISENYKTFVSGLKESLDSLRINFLTFNERVENSVRSTIEFLTNKANNNEGLVRELQSEIKSI